MNNMNPETKNILTEEDIQSMRKELQRVFPDWKFHTEYSKDDNGNYWIYCTIVSAPIDFIGEYTKSEYQDKLLSRWSIPDYNGSNEIRKIFNILDGGFPGSTISNSMSNNENSTQSKHSNKIRKFNWYINLTQGSPQHPFIYQTKVMRLLKII